MSGLRAATLAGLAAVLLGACTTTTTTTTRAPTGPAETRERMPASEESDATRRSRARLVLAGEYFANGQMEVALDEVKRAIAADPTQSAPYSLRGLIYANLGDDRLAEESFRRALELDSRDANAMHNYGGFLCQRKRYGEAQAMLDRALAVPGYREPVRTLLTKGICLAFDKQYVEAERTLARAQQFDPNSPVIDTNLAEVRYRLGQFEQAKATIARVNAVRGVANAQTLWLAVRIERALGNLRAAADLGARLKREFPNSPEAEAFDKGRFGD
jgi:type IV pilus assembly protein PilF